MNFAAVTGVEIKKERLPPRTDVTIDFPPEARRLRDIMINNDA